MEKIRIVFVVFAALFAASAEAGRAKEFTGTDQVVPGSKLNIFCVTFYNVNLIMEQL